MNEGQYDSKNVEHISIENIEVVSNGMDWKSRHLEAEKRKAEIRDRIHKQTEQGQKSAKDYFRPAKPTPSIYDSDLKRVAVYARVSTSSEEQISSIENQTLYYTKKIAETENWNLQDIYSDEGKSGTSLRKRDAFKRMMRDAKDQKIHPNWSGISVDSIHSLCLRAYLPEEVAKLNDIAEMRAGTKLEKPLRSEYLTISGTCFINQSSPVITISKNGIRFSKACHTRLDDCEHVELLYHPILQVVILRKSNRDASTAIHWENKDKICSSFSSKAFSGVIFEAMNWKWSCRYQCRGICRGEENAKFLIFELDESRILIRKNQYEQIEDRSMNLKCRLYRSKWVQSITVSDVMESGQVVENPMIGAIPSRNEVQRELDDLLMSM